MCRIESRRPRSPETRKQVFAEQQKGESASIKLEKASKAIQQVSQWQADLSAREQRLEEERKALTAKISDTSSLSKEDASDVKEALSSFVESLLDEDTDTAVENLTRALKGRGDATLMMDEEQIQPYVEKHLAEKQRIEQQRTEQAKAEEANKNEWSSARETFMATYPEIKPGTALWKYASKQASEIGTEDAFRDASYSEIFNEAGKRARALRKEVAPEADKLSKKLGSPRHVGSRASVQPSSQSQEQKPKTQTDLIANMRNRRRPTQNF